MAGHRCGRQTDASCSLSDVEALGVGVGVDVDGLRSEIMRPSPQILKQRSVDFDLVSFAFVLESDHGLRAGGERDFCSHTLVHQFFV